MNQKITDYAATIRWAIKTTWKFAKPLYFSWGILSVFAACMPVISINVISKVIDNLNTNLHRIRQENIFNYLLIFAAVYVIENLYFFLYDSINEMLYAKYEPVLYRYYFNLNHNLSLRTLECAAYNEKVKTVQNNICILLTFLSRAIRFIALLISVAVIAVNFLMMHSVVGGIALITILFRIKESSLIMKQAINFWTEMRTIRAQADYYYGLAFLPNKAKEIRMLSLETFIIDRWKSSEERFLESRTAMSNSRTGKHTACNCFDAVLAFLLSVIGAVLLGKSVISVGEFTYIILIVWKLFSSVGQASNEAGLIILDLADLKLHKEFEELCLGDDENPIVRKTENYVEYVPKQDKSDSAFELKNLQFSYSLKKKVLHDLTLSIGKGVTLICGDNGAGKSTLIKILLGLYPGDSSVLFFGHGYGELERCDLNRNIGLAIQDYCIYPYSFRDNIGFSLFQYLSDDEKIWDAAQKARVDSLIKSFGENGLDLMIGNWQNFQGIELSGGQKQKLAVARAYMGDKRIIILDEPAAQLDPIAEYLQFDELMAQSANKTIILISHRIGFASKADRIIVMENGSVVEDGTHGELLKLKGNYYNMFMAQAEWYSKTNLDNYSETGN